MESFHLFPGVFQPLRWFPGILILGASCPLDDVSKFFERVLYSSNLSCVGDYLTLHDFLNLPFHVALNIFGFPGRLFSVRTVGDFVWFQKRDMEDRVNFPAWRDIEFIRPIPSFF